MRDGKSVIAVVLGGKTARARDQQMVAILDQTMPKAVVMRDTGNRYAMLAPPAGPAPKPITRPESLDALIASVDEPDPDEEAYTGTDKVASLSATVPLRPVAREEAAPKPAAMSVAALPLKPTVDAEPAAAKSTAAPLDHATAYALAALGKAEGPVRRVGRDLGDLIVTPADASEGPQATAGVGLRNVVNESSLKTPTRGWVANDPLIPEGSWVIQIGAYSDQGDAVSRIRDAIRAAPAELQNAVPVTIPVQSSDNRTLYRSRFGGFEGEKEARNACGRLARQKISCIAIPPANWDMKTASR
jgi:D-alanyl-D-alanine carboxypeptidase